MDGQIVVEAVGGRGNGGLSVQAGARVGLLEAAQVLARGQRSQRLEDVLAVLLLQLDVLLSPPDGVDEGKLDQTSENESRTAEEPDLGRFDVADLGQRFALG